MTRQFTIRPGVAANQDQVIRALKQRGFYSSGIPRKAERGTDGGSTKPKDRQPSGAELMERYTLEVLLGRRGKFLKELSQDQFTALCAEVERSKS